MANTNTAAATKRRHVPDRAAFCARVARVLGPGAEHCVCGLGFTRLDADAENGQPERVAFSVSGQRVSLGECAQCARTLEPR